MTGYCQPFTGTGHQLQRWSGVTVGGNGQTWHLVRCAVMQGPPTLMNICVQAPRPCCCTWDVLLVCRYCRALLSCMVDPASRQQQRMPRTVMRPRHRLPYMMEHEVLRQCCGLLCSDIHSRERKGGGGGEMGGGGGCLIRNNLRSLPSP